MSFSVCHRSASRSVAARLEATDTSSPEKILAGLRLVETGLALNIRLQPTSSSSAAGGGGGLSATATGLAHRARGAALADEDCSLVQRSVSALCVRACAAVLQQAGVDAASRVELVEVGVRGGLSAVLALRAGLTR